METVLPLFEYTPPKINSALTRDNNGYTLFQAFVMSHSMRFNCMKTSGSYSWGVKYHLRVSCMWSSASAQALMYLECKHIRGSMRRSKQPGHGHAYTRRH